MRSVYTPMGPLILDSVVDEEKLSAELRGLDLLYEIASNSPNWRLELSSTRPFIRSNDGSPEVQIDVFNCISNKLVRNNDHLSITMSMKEICVITDFESNQEIPSSDAMISLIMLGNSGWPPRHTPETLEPKSIGYFQENCDIKDIKCSNLDFRDFESIERCKEHSKNKRYRECLIGLGELSRYLYVCKMVSVEGIVEFISPILKSVPAIYRLEYLDNPEEEYDSVFLNY